MTRIIKNLKMNEAIYNPNHIYKPAKDESVGVEQVEREVVAITENCVEVEENHPKALCKAVRTGVNTSYYILFSPAGRMFNPYGLYDASNQVRKSQGGKQFVMRSVPQKSFELYIKFLQTRNQSLLINAERENS